MESISPSDKHPSQLEKQQDANLDPEGALPSSEDEATASSHQKHYSFYLSMLVLALIAVIVAWDATALSLALPVSIFSPCNWIL